VTIPDAAASPRLRLYPQKIDDMLEDTFVRHDQELFRVLRDIGRWDDTQRQDRPANSTGTNWRPLTVTLQSVPRRATQLLDFETSHSLFMCLFCLLLTAEDTGTPSMASISISRSPSVSGK